MTNDALQAQMTAKPMTHIPLMRSYLGVGAISKWMLLALVLGVTAPVLAQPVQQIETGFERDVNRFRWTSNAAFAATLSGWDIALSNQFLSDAFILFEDQLNFRDEDRLQWRAERPIGTSFLARVQGRTAWFGQSRVLSQEMMGGLRWQARPALWVEPLLGVAMDQRPGVGGPLDTAPLHMDVGPAYGAQFSFTPNPVQEYQLQLQGAGTWQVITPRRGRTVQIMGAAERYFETTRLAASVRASSARRDTYQAVSFLNRNDSATRPPESIEATTSDTLDVGIELDAPLYRSLRLTGRFDVGLNNRYIRTYDAPEETLFFETDFNRRAIDTEIGLGYEQPDLSGRVAMQVGAATEGRSLANRENLPPTEAAQKSTLLQQADYDEGIFALVGTFRTNVSSRLALTFNGSSRIVRHDTPDVNPDDRDEVYHNGEFGLLVRMSRYLQADVKLFGSFYHTVYLNAERSAENNIQRSLRLRPSLRWTPTRSTDIRLGSEIRATYTVDDFVLQGRQALDQSAREMRLETEIDQQVGPGLRIRATGSYSDLRLGRLFWDDFTEIPFDTLRTYSGWLRLQTGQRIVADLGLRFFIRSDYDRTTTVRYTQVDNEGNVAVDGTGMAIESSVTRPGRRWIEQVGPTATITWPMGNASVLRLNGWLNIQHVRRRLYGALPEVSAEQIREAASKGTRKVIPNLTMAVVWRF